MIQREKVEQLVQIYRDWSITRKEAKEKADEILSGVPLQDRLLINNQVYLLMNQLAREDRERKAAR